MVCVSSCSGLTAWIRNLSTALELAPQSRPPPPPRRFQAARDHDAAAESRRLVHFHHGHGSRRSRPLRFRAPRSRYVSAVLLHVARPRTASTRSRSARILFPLSKGQVIVVAPWQSVLADSRRARHSGHRHPNAHELSAHRIRARRLPAWARPTCAAPSARSRSTPTIPKRSRAASPAAVSSRCRCSRIAPCCKSKARPTRCARTTARHRSDLTVDVDPQEPAARLSVGDSHGHRARRASGPAWLRAEFPLIPGLASATGMFRVYAKQLHPRFELYVSPVNIDPDELRAAHLRARQLQPRNRPRHRSVLHAGHRRGHRRLAPGRLQSRRVSVAEPPGLRGRAQAAALLARPVS